MKKVQKGFTLVELIVVITILAILGTIAFISLQGYSQDAKNSKVSSDMRTIVSAIETGVTDGTLTLSSVVDASGSGTSVEVAGATFGSGVLVASGTYAIGAIDFVSLRQNGADFIDPEGNAYVSAYISDSNNSDNTFYQVAGQTRTAAGTYEAVVKGNYIELVSGDIDGLISATTDADASGTGVTIGVRSGDNIGTGGLY